MAASTKGMKVDCIGVRIVKPRSLGNKRRHQLIHLRDEQYEYMPERTFRTLRGQSQTYPAVMSTRPVYKLIAHAS